MISLPVDFVSNVSTNATQLISALSPYITLILGVLLGVLVLSILISVLTHHK